MVILVFAVVLVSAAVLLFTHPDGRRWLVRWELGRPPTDEEVTVVVRHFRRRRIISVVTVIVATVALMGATVLAVVPGALIALLVAELLDGRGIRRRVGASLVPRWARWARWSLATAVAVGLFCTAWLTQWWDFLVRTEGADATFATLPPTFVLSLCALVATLAVVETVIRVTRARAPITGVDGDIDLLLRARAARVATGLGLAILGYLLSVTGAYVGDRLQPLNVPGWTPAFSGAVQVVGVILGIVAWIWVANPPTRPVLVSRP